MRVSPPIDRRTLLAPLLASLAPPLCLACRARLPRAAAGPAICAGCSAEIDRTPSRVLAGDGIDAGFAALPYAGPGRGLVHALKFSRLLIAAELGAALIASRAPARVLGGAIVPMPPAPLRLARRGFDPAAELAGSLVALTGLESAPSLRRRDLRHQRGSSRGERLARPPEIVPDRGWRSPPEVLLIDDVVTTGATLDACAAALREAGAERVCAAALAAVDALPRVVGRGRRSGVE